MMFVPEAREDVAMEYRWLHFNDPEFVEDQKRVLKNRTRKTIKKPFINDD